MSLPSLQARTVIDFDTPQNVSTLTVLMPWRSVDALRLDAVLLSVVNLSASETLSVTFETSEDGVSPDGDRTYIQTAAPLSSASIEAGSGALRSYWRISANTQGPAFNVAQAKWRMRGQPRLY